MSGAGPLPFKRRLGYGVGDLGFNLFFTTASLYLLYYYTDVLGLSPSVGGWIFAAALVWDAVTDPIMGYIASRTRSRWGRYRPYILFGSVPLAASWILMFVPTGATGSALALLTLATHMLFRTAYTVVSMPFLSLSAAMTSDSQERGVLAAFRMMAATAGGLCIAFFTLKLVGWLGQGDDLRGFLYTAILFAVIATLLLWVTFATTVETYDASQEPVPTASDMTRLLRANRAFWLVGGSMLMAAMAATFFNKSIPYFFKYGVGREELIGPALAALTAAAMVSIPLWTALMRRSSKRIVSLSGVAVGVAGYLLFWSLPPTRPDLLIAAIALIGLSAGAAFLTFWAMLPDTVEYGEFRSGVRAEGILFGCVAFIQKAALGLGVGLLGEVLTAIGYVANQPQGAATLDRLRLMMVLAPIGFALLGALFIYFYPLDPRTHGRLVRAIAWRRSGATRRPRP